MGGKLQCCPQQASSQEVGAEWRALCWELVPELTEEVGEGLSGIFSWATRLLDFVQPVSTIWKWEQRRSNQELFSRAEARKAPAVEIQGVRCSKESILCRRQQANTEHQNVFIFPLVIHLHLLIPPSSGRQIHLPKYQYFWINTI